MSVRWLLSFLILIGLTLSAPAQEPLLVFVPASASGAVEELAETYEAKTGQSVIVSLASTSHLARQLAAGAPADIFISVDDDWLQWLAKRNLINSQSQHLLARNRLVLAVRREVENWTDWKALVTQHRFAMSEARSVPAGRYAKAALEYFELWEQARPNAIFGEHARVTLAMLARGDVGAALTYQSDLELNPDIRAAFHFPPESHAPIRVTGVLTARARVEAAAFLDYLNSEPSRQVFVKKGFLAP